MSARENIDEGTQAVAAVMGTPIGRRWVLKAGLGGAAAAVLGAAGITPATAAPSAPKPTGNGPRDRIVFQFALGAAAKLADLKVAANGQRIALTPHTAATRKKLRSQGTLFGKINTGVLTHYAELRLPRDLGLVLLVSGTRGGEAVLVATHVYAPVQGIRQVALAANKLDKSYRLVAGSPVRAQMLGLDPGTLKNWQEVADLDAIVDSQQSAIGLVFVHPNVATKDPVNLTTTKFLVAQTSEVQTLGTYLDTMANNGVAFATQPTPVNSDGKTPTQIKIDGKLTTFQTTQLNTTDSTFRSNLSSGIVAGVHAVRDTPSLGKVVDQPLDVLKDPSDTSTWHTYEGSLPEVTNYTGPSVGDSGVTVTLSRPGFHYGTKAEASGAFANGALPMTFYNNYVRWVTVLVQYLDVKGNNLSHITTGPAPTWPSTTYAHGVGLLPQVMTLLGIPLFGTNTLNQTLNFPDKAVSARILYCGLGNNSADGGWAQYFEGAYPAGQMAPKNEVMVPALITGILSIGVTAFALAVDLDMATTWKILNKITLDNVETFEDLLASLYADAPWATAAEVFGMSAAAGAASYADVSANGGAQNLWVVICNALASMIPKIIFNPATEGYWGSVAAAIFSDEIYEKALTAIPFLGLVMDVLAAVGDAITLAEAIGESAASPWVIENTITLGYPVTVTIGYDNVHAATWPETAATWALQSSIDGTTVGKTITGSMNVGGRTGNAPIVYQGNTTYGGDFITWSIVILDDEGNQVGTGSAQLANNGATPPSNVSFNITELPETVTSTTIFERRDTVVYDSAAGGYTWSDTAAVSGTVIGSPIQEVTSVSVSTRLGVTAVVWKQNDKYYLRGVSAIEDSTTLTMGTATKQGYARRPFVLIDPFVGPTDDANHVLLEPDDTGDGYHIRTLSIDSTTGSLSWDSATSTGYFPMAIDAAALSTTGFVVTIHTASGRVGSLVPTSGPTAIPALARYAAGPGRQPGLLTAPTALAVTSSGTVIILNAGSSQLSAFDLVGLPVKIFGTGSQLSFTLQLPQTTDPTTRRTYLDVSVDGTGQMYVLSYAGSGATAAQYRVDVYQANGTPLVTGSTGMNVPHLAVDYWRSIHAANYTPILDSSGNPRIDPSIGVIEPSMSRFDPK